MPHSLPESAAHAPEVNVPFRLGAILVEPSLNQLHRDGRTEKIEPRLMRVLCLLAARPGDVLSRDALLDEVWEGYAQDEALTQAVSKLRRALGDRARDARFIETIPKSGYRLVAPVSFDEAEREDAPSPPTARRQRTLYAGGASVVGLAVLGVLLAMHAWLPAPPTPVATPQPIPLTTYRGQERDPSIAPDGQRIAFSWDQGEPQTTGIFVKQIGSERPLQLTEPEDGQDRHPAWSPDGRVIAFTRHTERGRGLYLVPAIGGAERLVARRPQDIVDDIAWAPDGAGIVMPDRARPDAPLHLTLIAPDGSTERRLTDPPDGIVGDIDPVFSPDGAHLAFSRTIIDGVADVYVMAFPDGPPRRITTWERVILSLSWSTDGTHLLAASLRDGGYRLYRIPLDAGAPEPVFASSEPLFSADLDATTGQLVYVASDTEVNLWTHTPGGAPDQPRVSSTTWDSQPRLSPDGQHLAFASVREVAPEIWVSDADGTNPRRLTRFVGPYVGAPAWSPDGERLVFDARADGQADLYSIPVEGGPVRRLTSTPHDEVLPSWSRDGKTLYFASNASGQWQIMAWTPDAERLAPVTTEGGYGAQESMDGTTLYYTRRGEDGLWQKPLPDGLETRLLPYPTADWWGAWDVTDVGLLALRDGAGTHLMLVDPRTRTEHLWAALDATVPGKQRVFSATRDGRTLYYSRIERRESDLKRLVWPGPL